LLVCERWRGGERDGEIEKEREGGGEAIVFLGLAAVSCGQYAARALSGVVASLLGAGVLQRNVVYLG
jgi:hypothetical protein